MTRRHIKLIYDLLIASNREAVTPRRASATATPGTTPGYGRNESAHRK